MTKSSRDVRQTNFKRTIKFLAINKDPNVLKRILRSAPDIIIKSICNAAYNLAQGDVHLSPKEKQNLAKYRAIIRKLIRKNDAVSKKRRILNQKGGFLPLAPLVPLLLQTALATIPAIFSIFSNKK